MIFSESKGQVSAERAMKLWNNLLVHDDGVCGVGGQFVNLVGPFGKGKSTLLMQAAQYVRHLDYTLSKETARRKKFVKEYPETVIMRGLSDDHWNCLIPKNWKNSFPEYGKPKPLVIHIHTDDAYEFYEISIEKKRKINSELNIKKYNKVEELFDNIRMGAINVVYEPSDYYLTPNTLRKLNQSKLKEYDESELSKKIPAQPQIFWFEFIEFICSETQGAFVTIIIDEFHLVAPAYMQGDLFHMVTWLTHKIIHMRKKNISMMISTHDENLIDYRIKERIMTKIWFKGAVPKNSMIVLSLLRHLEDIGQAIIEERNIEFGKFEFNRIPKQPPVVTAKLRT